MGHIISFLRGQRADNRLIAIGHRVVHGGLEFSQPTVIDSDVLTRLEKLIPLAPLHQPHNLTPIRIASELMPEIPQIACFRYCVSPQPARCRANVCLT
jgi:acetate kinase